MRRRNPSSADTPRHAFTIIEVAESLGVGEHSVRSLIECGALDTIRIGTRVIIPAWSLENFVRAGAAPSSANSREEENGHPDPECGQEEKRQRAAAHT